MSCDVSVIIPTYNSSATLGRALDSVFFQSLPPREIIVIDDASGDWEKSKLIAESYPETIPIHFRHRGKNKGPSIARNIGISLASCRYIAFLDSDDIWFKDKLKVQCCVMDRCKADLSTHKYIFDVNARDDDMEGSYDKDDLLLSSLSPWTFLFRNYATPTIMVVREKMVPFDQTLRRNEDWKCWMEILSRSGYRGVDIRLCLAGGFKPGIGISGLSQDIEAMHNSRLLALKSLRSEGNISPPQYLVGTLIETIKYPVRNLRIALGRF